MPLQEDRRAEYQRRLIVLCGTPPMQEPAADWVRSPRTRASPPRPAPLGGEVAEGLVEFGPLFRGCPVRRRPWRRRGADSFPAPPGRKWRRARSISVRRIWVAAKPKNCRHRLRFRAPPANGAAAGVGVLKHIVAFLPTVQPPVLPHHLAGQRLQPLARMCDQFGSWPTHRLPGGDPATRRSRPDTTSVTPGQGWPSEIRLYARMRSVNRQDCVALAVGILLPSLFILAFLPRRQSLQIRGEFLSSFARHLRSSLDKGVVRHPLPPWGCICSRSHLPDPTPMICRELRLCCHAVLRGEPPHREKPIP